MDNKEQVINAVVEGIEKLAIDSTTSVSGTVSKYGPKVLDTAETYIRLVAIIKFIEIFIPLTILSICLYCSIKLVKKCIVQVRYDNSHGGYNDGTSAILSTFLSIIFVASVIFCGSFIDIDLLLSIISPKMELIKLSKDAVIQYATGGK